MDVAPQQNAPRPTDSERFANALLVITGATFFGHCIWTSCEGSGYPFLLSTFPAALLLVTSVLFGSGWRHPYRRALAGVAVVLINLFLIH